MSVITEAVDPSTALVAPTVHLDESLADELDADCGLALGSVMWAIHKIFDYDIPSEICKKFTGDWSKLKMASEAWKHSGVACRAVGTNLRTVGTESEGHWTGDASEAFRGRMDQLAEGYQQYGEGCDLMAEVSSSIAEVAKSGARLIGVGFSFIADLLDRLIAEVSIPVVGWVVGAADAAVHIKSFWSKIAEFIRTIKSIIETVKKAIESIGVLRKILEVLAKIGEFAVHALPSAHAASAVLTGLGASGPAADPTVTRAVDQSFGT